MKQSKNEKEMSVNRVSEAVGRMYGKIARGETPGCGCGCTSATEEASMAKTRMKYAEDLGYTRKELAELPEEANLGLGCGNPRLLAGFRYGETVLDLGSGAGVDCFNAARAVGDSGRVIGVDMTADMLWKSRRIAEKRQIANVEFRLGEIENLPVADNEIDVIISNCVINLSSNKRRAYEEMLRVLKPGGRLAISDIVALKELPQTLQSDLEMIAACIGGAQQIGGIKTMLTEIGFKEVHVESMGGARQVIAEWFPKLGLEEYVTSATITAVKPLNRPINR